MCVLRGELTPAAPPTVDSLPAAVPLADDTIAPVDDEDERARMRLTAAMNIFDAEEIEPLDGGGASSTVDG
jgi:hypothetical protein